MTQPSGPRIAMLVYNNCTTDTRVLKEASSLAEAGCDVMVIAVRDRTTSPHDRRDGFAIVRIDRNPVHYRILRGQRQLMRYAGRGPKRWLRFLRGRLRRLLGPRWRRERRRLWRLRVRAQRHAGPPWRRTKRRALRWRIRVQRLLAPRWRRERRRVWRMRIRAGRVLGPRRRRARRRLWRAVRAKPQETENRSPTTVEEPHDAAVEQPNEEALPVADATSRPASPQRTRLWRALMRVHKPLMFLDYYIRAYRVLRRERLDAVHAHDLNTLPAAAAVARAHRVPLIYDSHELYTEISTLSARERRVWRVVERLLIRRADHTVTVCTSIADELVARYEISPPLILLNTPPQPDKPIETWDGSPLRERLGLQGSSEALVLYQGGFAPHRGLEALVASAAGFDRGILVLMGWGTLEDDLRGLIGSLGLQERVRMIEPVPPELLLRYTAGADLGVIPYRPVGLNNYYSTPNKLFEYMTAGLPVVASRLPELVRFVEGLRIGRTFDPDEPEEIASAVNRVLGDPRGRAAMRERAIEASRSLHWDAQVEGLLRLYRVAPERAPTLSRSE